MERHAGRRPAPRKGSKGNAGEIIPPAPPWFALRLRRAAGLCGCRMSCLEKAAEQGA